MNRVWRAGSVLVGLVLTGAATAAAQIPGMPLFTNPRYGTGIRVHVDAGRPTETRFIRDTSNVLRELNETVVQAGATFALGPLGVGANLGALQSDLENCQQGPSQSCDIDTRAVASALAQLRIAGGGRQNLSLSLFGGATTDINAYDVAGIEYPRLLIIPVGAAIGLRIPLGLASLNLWGAPRWVMQRYINCTGPCPSADEGVFRWAAGADFPIFRIFSVRAAFDSGKDEAGNTVSVIGVGASVGIGGMR